MVVLTGTVSEPLEPGDERALHPDASDRMGRAGARTGAAGDSGAGMAAGGHGASAPDPPRAGIGAGRVPGDFASGIFANGIFADARDRGGATQNVPDPDGAGADAVWCVGAAAGQRDLSDALF